MKTEIDDEAVKLKKELREACPEFRAWRRDDKEPSDVALPDVLREEGDHITNTGTRNVIHLD